ncbi:hypothetical protein B0T21DRAFT_353634 [Apiosordaria backusii]|uniref:Uncharacterized protein n=1 Tax=Apiosordaria backusii TaxID=314023 RepID=A0AA39ZPY7_9PEZI|nr:hypothetical protein B0T21DRAFT_353634 [Apiosordaria backusii]
MKFLSLAIAVTAASTQHMTNHYLLARPTPPSQSRTAASPSPAPEAAPATSRSATSRYTNDRADFTGPCNTREGDKVRPVGGCDGVDVRWISDAGNGVGILQVRDAEGWDEFTVDQCDSPTPTSIRCTYNGGCNSTQV